MGKKVMSTESLKKEENSIDNKNNACIVLYNDNVNSFDYVITCLVVYCNHSVLQAEQCTHIVHNKGKYAVKEGDFEDLLPINEALQMHLLKSQIEFL